MTMRFVLRVLLLWLSLAVGGASTTAAPAPGRKITFEGRGSSTLTVARVSSLANLSLEEFLKHGGGVQLLVGSDDLSPSSSGGSDWESRQPSLTVFGYEMTPIFRIGLSHEKSKDGTVHVSVRVKESRTQVHKLKSLRQGQQTPTIPAISHTVADKEADDHWLTSVFSRVAITGGSNIVVQPTATGWEVSLESDLNLRLVFPKYLPIPPGFSSVGSAIMKAQCEDRAQKTLEKLLTSYNEWVNDTSERPSLVSI